VPHTHISRRELKKDDFRDTLAHGAEVLTTHKSLIWQVSVVVIVAACAVFFWRYYTGRQTAQSSAAFAAAMKIYQAPAAEPGQSPPPGELSYPSDAVKYAAAQQALGQVAMRFPRSRYGQMARYYAAVSLDQLGRYPDAVNWLAPMADRGDAQLQALAKFELAHVYDQMNKGAQAVALYQQLAGKPTVFVPKAMVLLALGDHYLAQKDSQQAAKYYRQVKSEFPNTGLADQADQRLEMMGKS
jgi:predicted negative regulator of RcsB-dependent stress response